MLISFNTLFHYFIRHFPDFRNLQNQSLEDLVFQIEDRDKKSEEEEPVVTEATEATDWTQPAEGSDKDRRQEALHNIQSEKCIVFVTYNWSFESSAWSYL